MLFRQEVIEHQQSRHMGQVLLLAGTPVWLILCITLFLIASLLFFLIYGTFTRRITVSGEVISLPHTVNLFAPEQGVISRLLVDTGQVVEPGTPLYQLDTSRVSLQGNLSATTLVLLRQQQQQADEIIRQLEKNRRATISGLKQQLEQTLQARKISDDMVASATEGMAIMKRNMENYDRYRKRGLITTDQQNNQRYLYYQQQYVWHSLNSQSLQQDQQILNLRSEIVTRAADFDSQIAENRIRRNDTVRQIAEVTAESLRLITAPSSGRVSSLSVTEGQMVSAGDSLAQLVPSVKPQLYLIAWLPNNSIPYVRPAERVNIRYAAYPAEKYGQFAGSIMSVFAAPVPSGELEGWASAPSQREGQSSESWFKAIVGISPTGMRWQGSVLYCTASYHRDAGPDYAFPGKTSVISVDAVALLLTEKQHCRASA